MSSYAPTTTRSMELRLRRHIAVPVGAAMAAAIAAASVFNIQLAIVAVLGVAFLCAAALRPAYTPAVLIVSVFIENVSFGGTTISRILAPIALFAVLIELLRGKAWVPVRAQLVWAFLYAFWAVTSTFWSVSPGETFVWLQTLAASLTYMLAFGALLGTQRDLERVLYAGTAAALVSGLLGFITFFIEGAYRATGEVGDANFFAAYQIVALPVALVLLTRAKRWSVRILLLVASVGIIGSIMTSLSRGGLLALATIVLLVLLLPTQTIFRSRVQKMAIAIVIAAGATAALAVSFADISARVESLTQGEEASGSGRLNEWKAAWGAFEDRPLRGLGYGAFQDVSNELVKRTPGADLVNFDLRPQGTLAHSAYLGTMADVGLPGLIFFVGLLIATARALRAAAVKARRAGEDFIARLSNALLVAFIGFCLTSIFLSSEVARPLWVIVGLSLTLPKLLESRARERAQSKAEAPSDPGLAGAR